MKKAISFLLIFTALIASARSYSPDEITNPNIANRFDYVADPENLLSEQTKATINSRLHSLRSKTSAEAAVAIVPSIGNYTPEDFSEKLFTRWGLGKKDKDNGVLLVISPDDRFVRIQTGYGAEGVLPDITCAHIYETTVIPNMRNDCLDCAADEATKMIAEIMEDPVYAEELRSKLADNYSGEFGESPISGETFMQFFGIVATILWIIAAAYYVMERRKTKRLPSKTAKAQGWRSSLVTLGALSAATLLTALPFFLLALYHYRRARYGSHKCDNCGGTMRYLKGSDAMGSLTPSQQFEVKLGSVNYDVHKCDKCGNTEVADYPVRNSTYTPCPKCGTRAYHYLGNRTLRQPTYSADGEGVSQYRCEYCGHQNDQHYRIPKKDMAAAMAAGAILGAASRRGGGGFSGGFGGGFGGGSTGGGGATGRW